MEISTTEQGAVTVVAIVGSLDALTAPQLSEFLSGQLANGRVKLVADLSGLEYTSSAGLRVILNTVKEARQKSGDVRLTGMNANVNKVFEMSGFQNILKIFPDVATAITSYG